MFENQVAVLFTGNDVEEFTTVDVVKIAINERIGVLSEVNIPTLDIVVEIRLLRKALEDLEKLDR